jgi:hypothetical protein
MDSANPLSQLADIHLPEPVGFWPPAPGWWLLFFVLCAAAVWTARRYYAGWKLARARSFALAELDKQLATLRQQSAHRTAEEIAVLNLVFVSDVNAVLRRVAMKNFQHENFASLGGAAWISFLRDHGDASLLDDGLARTLSEGRFARAWDVDTERLYKMAHQWISSLYLARIAPDKSPKNASSKTPVSDHA